MTTYGKLGRSLTQKAVKKSIDTTRKTVGMRVGNLIRFTARSAAVGVPEGIEEMFQETYEDWIVKKNFAAMEGKEFMSYWDYFSSKEARETQAVAFFIGMGMGGGVHAVNSIANSSRTIENRQKLLEEVLNNPTLDEEMKKAQILSSLVAGAYAYGTEADIRSYVDKLYEDGSIDEDSHKKYTQVIDDAGKAFDNIPFIDELTPEMKEEYLYRSMNISDLNNNKTDLDESLAENIAKIKEMKGMTEEQQESAINQAIEENNEMKSAIDELIAENESMQASIINELITKKGSDQRTRYRKGVTKGARGEEVRGGRYAGETDVLSDKERSRLTKEGQRENWNEKYRDQAIDNLNKEGIPATPDNILQEMRRLSQEPKTVRTGVRTALQGVGRAIKKGVKGVRKGIQKVREAGIVDTVTGGLRSAVQGIKNVISGDTNIKEVISNLAQASGQVSKKIFSYAKTFVKNFKGQPINQEDGTPTEPKFGDKVIQILEDATGQPFTKMNPEEKRSLIMQLFPFKTMDQVANMTNEEFDNYMKERINELAQQEETIEKEPIVTPTATQQDPDKLIEGPKQEEVKPKKKASVKTMITQADRQALKDLGYTQADIRKMRPEDAQKILDNKIKKKKVRKGVGRKKKVDKVTPEEKQSKKRKKKKDTKGKKKKTPDPFGNKKLKVKKEPNRKSSKIDRIGEVNALSAINDVIRKYRTSGKTMDKTAIIVVSELTEVVPSYALGQAFATAVFIRGGSAWQDTLAHEYGGHIYYRAYAHTDIVKDAVKNIMGTELWDTIKESYYNLTMYKFTNPVSGETTNLTIEDIGGIINRYMDDKRTNFSKSEQAEYRNIREAINNVLNSTDYVSRQKALKRLEIQLKAADMIEDLPDNQQEALKEEAFAKSTEENSKEVVSQMLGIEKLEVHEKLASRFWSRAKRQFSLKDDVIKRLTTALDKFKLKYGFYTNFNNFTL